MTRTSSISSVSLGWQDVFDGNFPEPDPLPRRVFRETLAEVAAKAKTALPDSNGRVEKAVQIVLAGDIVPHEDGRFFVGSQSDTRSYIVLDNVCDCKDYEKAPQNLCKHVIASMLWRRATPLAQERMAALDTPAAASHPVPLPEAPVSANVHVSLAGRDVMLTLQDADEGRLLARLEALLRRFPNGDAAPKAPSNGHAQEGWCSKHQCEMKRSKDGQSYYHKAGEKPDGKAVWCRGK